MRPLSGSAASPLERRLHHLDPRTFGAALHDPMRLLSRRLAALLLGALLIGSAGAPEATAQVTVTVQAGMQAVDLSEPDPLIGQIDPSVDAVILDQRPRYGLRAGIGLNVPITSGVAVQPELVYAQKGGQLIYVLDNNGGFSTASARFYDDIEGLLMLNLDVLRDDAITAGIEAGPGVMVRLGETACRASRFSPTCFDDDDPGRVSLGLAVGAVVSMGVGGVGVRYTRGGRDTAPAGTQEKPVAETIAITFRVRFR